MNEQREERMEPDTRTPIEREMDAVANFDFKTLFDTPHNRGARIADDHFCPGCSKRGHFVLCNDCCRDLHGGR